MKQIIQDFAFVLIFIVLIILLMVCCYQVGHQDALNQSNAEKTALEIKILKHELKAYEAMEKELGNEPTIEP